MVYKYGMEIIKLMYEHPFATFFFLIGLSWVIGSFKPFVTKIEDENKEENE